MTSAPREYNFVLPRATIVIALFSLLSRIAGLLRDRFFAVQFGAGDTLDVYYAAFRIPDFIYNLLILGTLSAAFIPVFSEYLLKNKSEAWRIANSILNLTVIIMGALSLVLVFLSPLIVSFIVPGFSQEKTNETLQLTRIMLLSPFFFSVSSVFSSILNSHKRFGVVAALPVVYNLAIIAGLFALYPFFGISGLAWGVVAGAFLHMCLQMPQLYSLGFRWRKVLDVSLPGVKEISRLFLPRILTMDLGPLIAVAIGSTLASGSIAVYNLASNLQSVPLGVIAISFATVAFPLLAQASAASDRATFKEVFNLNLSQILYFIVPLSVLILVLRAQIVRLVLGAGSFGWDDTRVTVATLGFFTLSLFAQGLIPLFSRAFFSLKDTLTPVLVSLLAAGVNIFLALYFAKSLGLGVAGLALAFSVSSIFSLLLLFVLLEVKFGNLLDWDLVIKLEKILIATLSMGISAYAMLYAADTVVNTHTVAGLSAQGAVAACVGLAAYLLVGSALNLGESRHILITSKLWLNKLRTAFISSLQNPL